ncbi:MAG: matrixin family metalloprotease [Candidatus Nitrosocaldaceae archaeon]
MSIIDNIRGLAIITVASITIILLPITSVYATDYYSGRRWGGTTVDLCYDAYGLSSLRIDGQINQYTKVQQQIDIARNDWNNLPSRFTLNKVRSDQWCINWVYGANRGYNGPAAETMLCINSVSTCYYSFDNMPSDNIVKAAVTFNTYDSWSTTRECTSWADEDGPWTLNYVARHEFGHWVAFKHTATVSVMYYLYNCNYRDSIKQHDSDSLTSIYG